MISVPSPDAPPAPTDAPAVPDWFEPGDPWLSERMRQVADIASAEHELGIAIEQALALYLDAAHQALLGRARDAVLAAATPDLASWPERERGWLAALAKFVFDVLAWLFSKRFREQLREERMQAQLDEFVQAYLQAVWQRLKLFPEIIFEEVRSEISTALAAGDTAEQVRERVSDLLALDAPTRALAAQMDLLRRTIANESTPDSVRREAKARLASLMRRKDRLSSRWWPKVAELARTEAVSVLNAATHYAAEVYEKLTGKGVWRQWWSTRDSRVRHTHRVAHGQTRPIYEKFVVGGYPMDYPGDPTAPLDLTVNCRCSLLRLSAAEGRRLREEYESRSSEAALTAASDPEGGPMAPAPTTEDAVIATEPEHEVPPVLAAGKLPDDAAVARWSGVLAPLGVPSGDGRIIAPPDGPPQYRDLPLPLLYQEQTADGHDGSIVVGSIDRVWAQDGLLMGSGRFDLGNEKAMDVVRQIDDGFHRWVSVRFDLFKSEFRYYREGRRLSPEELSVLDSDEGVDIYQVSSNWRLMSATLVAEPAFGEAAINILDDGADLDDPDAVASPAPPRALAADAAPVEPEDAEAAEFAGVTAEKRQRAEKSGAAMENGRYPIENEADLRKAIKAVGRAGGKNGTPAERDAVRRHIIARAKALKLEKLIPFYWGKDGTLGGGKGKHALLAAAEPAEQAWYERVAAAVPMEPPAAWFADPQLTGPMKVTVTAEGRVFGHIAPWEARHASRPDQVPPRARDTSYSKFHRHPVRCEDGSRVRTGPLAGMGHADERERALWAVQRHYDNPAYVLADVVVGEDEHGIWCSGSLRYGVEAWQVMFLDRYSFSGDWRGGELLAACLASVPGFHLPADCADALAASAGALDDVLVADGAPVQFVEDGEAVTFFSAGIVPGVPAARAATSGGGGGSSVSVAVKLDPDPEEWGRRMGQGFYAGQAEAERAAAEAAQQAQLADFAAHSKERMAGWYAARAAELAARVNKPALDRERAVAELRARVENGQKVSG